MNFHEQLTANFYRWEQRGRGVEVFPAAAPPLYQDSFPGCAVVGSRRSVLRRLICSIP
jgi:hypothetical protein